MSFYTCTHNPIARAGIIRKLMKMGYKLAPGTTVSHYFTKYPAHAYPNVVVSNMGIFVSTVPWQGCQKVSPVTLAGVPSAHQSDLIAISKNLVFAPPAKYKMEYQKADGTVNEYTIANPIEANNEEFRSYAWGRGIRTFKHSRVRKFTKI